MNNGTIRMVRGALALTLALPLAAAAAGGTIVKAEGRAVVERGGTEVLALQATALQPGDTLRVDPLGKVHVQFEDDSLFVIPGPARLRVDEFQMPATGAGGKAVYTLADGGFRTVTGRISKGRKDTYELRNELANVTVRGSAYTAVRCRQQCAKAKPGLYVRGEKGLITVANPAGKLQLRPGQVAYADENGSAPVLAQASPFIDPIFAESFGFSIGLDLNPPPPRIEQEPSASPS